jgi:branched-chain amino acid transport system substrate-binding protein
MIRALSAGAVVAVLSLNSVAFAADPIKIGGILATTGNDVPQGSEMTNGMRLAIEHFGPQVNGRDIQLLVEDDSSNPSVGLQKVRKLIQSDKVDMIAGVQLSAVALAVAPVVAAAKVPMILSLSSANALTGEKCSPWVFRASYSNAQIAEPYGPWVAAKGYKNIFILGADFVTPREFAGDFRRTFEKAGGKVIAEVFSPFGKTQDFGPYLAQARSANPDAILGLYYGAEAILFTKQYESFGLKGKIPLISMLGTTPAMLRQAQGDSAEGVISSLNYIPELQSPENIAFQKAYREKFNASASEFAVMGYDSMRFAIEAAKKVNGNVEDKVALAKAISQVSFTGPRGPTRMNPANNNVDQNIYIAKTVKKGDAVVFELIDTIPNVTTDASACKMAPLQ